MKTLFYIIIIYPVSALPLRFLYLISDIIAIFLHRGIKYRLSTVRQNLQNSFPEKSLEELGRIEKNFYHHLADLFIEGIKTYTLSKKQVLRHYHCTNPELLLPYYEKKQSLILVSSHYNNWEYMVLSLSLQFQHHGVGVGKAMSNKAFERMAHKSRIRYGTEVVFDRNVRQTFEKYENEKIPTAYMMLSDQSPRDPGKSYWTEFLHQDTAFIYGAEYFARKYKYPVFYYEVIKVKRGYYHIRLHPVITKPEDIAQLPQHKTGYIMQACIERLEKTIIAEPTYWLWSHKRWKHQRPQTSPKV